MAGSSHSERRDFHRLPVLLTGLCRIGAYFEPFEALDVSCNGMLLKTKAIGRIGAHVQLMLGHIGDIRATVVRVTRIGFAVSFDLTNSPHTLNALARELAHTLAKPPV